MIKPAFLLAGVLLMLALPAHAGDTSGVDDAPALNREATASGQAADAPAAAESVGQQFARDRLLTMARALGEAERFSVSLRISYDVVQEDGQKIEFGEIRELEIARPDKVRIVESAGDGFHDLLVFDGKSITVFNDASKVFAQAPQPGDIDASVRYFVRDLQMRLPLAPLLMRDFAGELQRRIRSIDYVGRTDILGEPAHHIAVRTARVDFQVWIADADPPVPLRVVVTYPASDAHPQFRADFSKWNLAPTFAADRFAFMPSADARQIPFAVQFVAPPDAGASLEADVTGGAKP